MYNILKFIYEIITIKTSKMFDANFYLSQYSDDISQKIDPLIHFLKDGWKRGKNPSSEFDTNYYLERNPDVKNSGLNPLIHYIRAGKKEGRAPKFSISKNYPNYYEWIKRFDIVTKNDLKRIKSEINKFQIHPKITFFIISEEIQIEWFSRLIDSMKNQLYDHWEAIIFSNPHDKRIISNITSKIDQQNKIQLFAFSPEVSKSEQLNKAIDKCSGKFVCFISQDVILRPHTLSMIVKEINNDPDLHIIYTDEDQIDQSCNRTNPYFKPDWNPDLFISQDYLHNTSFFHTDTVKEIGGFRGDFNDSKYWDLTLRLSLILSEKQIKHIPFVLFQKIERKNGTNKTFSIGDRKEYRHMLQSNFKHSNFVDVQFQSNEENHPKIIFNIPDPNPLVSIIIPTRNSHHLLQKCIDSVLNKTIYQNFEIIIINNNSDDQQSIHYLSTLEKNDKFMVLTYPYQFNYSAINNLGAKHANGEVLILLNDDTEIISESWINELVSHALRPTIGAVGAMLYYPNDNIQHAGIILNNKNIAAHVYVNEPRGYKGQRTRASLIQNYSAVTGACLAIEKKKFVEIGGFDEKHLPIAYNDIDLCLKLMKAGYRNLWTPHAELYHQESATRDDDTSPTNKIRLDDEARFMREKWRDFLTNDPAYNPNLSINYPMFSLAYPPRVIRPWKK